MSELVPLSIRIGQTLPPESWRKEPSPLSAASSGGGVLLITSHNAGPQLHSLFSELVHTVQLQSAAMNALDCDLLRKNLCPRKGRSRCSVLVSCLQQFLKPMVEMVVGHRVQSTSMVLIFNSKLTDSVNVH